jgi:hypothetical protein
MYLDVSDAMIMMSVATPPFYRTGLQKGCDICELFDMSAYLIVYTTSIIIFILTDTIEMFM